MAKKKIKAGDELYVNGFDDSGYYSNKKVTVVKVFDEVDLIKVAANSKEFWVTLDEVLERVAK